MRQEVRYGSGNGEPLGVEFILPSFLFSASSLHVQPPSYIIDMI